MTQSCIKIRVHKNHCKNCVWFLQGNVCPFVRCVRSHGWTVDERSEKDGRKTY
ncbi:hypothetical protein Cdeb_00331 [Caldibacillus debilis GB1]|uniref:Uncharacterized protein n=1 Tax=Caldibacillus debilis GB1 TaxID=1339248 RepID=A0A420VHY3_9BACI|nr:hypothetical protein Cdeb_00331 [Caldibacillus debilis GB1]